MTAPVRRTRSVRMLVGLATVLALAASTWSDGLLTARQAVPPPPAPPPVQRVTGAPAGEVIKAEFDQSKVYPGTWREYWVYVPKQLDRARPAPVMVFQDGLQYSAPIVFDNLIHAKAIPRDGRRVRHARPRPGAVGRCARSHEPELRVRLGERRLRALPARRASAARRQDPRVEPLERSERPRDCRQQQRRDCRVRRRLAAARRLPPCVQRDRHLRRTARRQRVSRPHPQDRAQTDPRLSAGRPQRSEQLHRELVRRQPGHAVGARVRGLRRASRVGRRRAQLAARDRALSRRR